MVTALRQTLHFSRDEDGCADTLLRQEAGARALTAPWPGRRSPGSRCPFCSGPSSAPAGPGWASVLPQPGLQSRQSLSVGGRAGPQAPFLKAKVRGTEGAIGTPVTAESVTRHHCGAGGASLPPLRPSPKLGRLSGVQRRPGALPAVPRAHLMVRCSTWCMADTVFSQATCREGNRCAPARLGPFAPRPVLPTAACESAACAESRGCWFGHPHLAGWAFPPAEQSWADACLTQLTAPLDHRTLGRGCDSGPSILLGT